MSGTLDPRSIRGLGVAELRRVGTTSRVVVRNAWPILRSRKAPDLTRRAAVAARRAFIELGPTYVKLAQVIGSSPGLFPEVLSDELRLLLDQVPPDSYESIAQVIREDLGASPSALYAELDPEPLASASVAQVHAARLHSGEQVVVKVQRPAIVERIRSDLRIMRLVARLLERSSAQGRMANPVAVIEDYATTLSEELNFVLEARSMEAFEANLRRFGDNQTIRVPAVDWPLTTPRVLTMERIWGYKLDDLPSLTAAGFDLPATLKRGVRAWMEGAFEHGLFHGDVHAGNLLIDTEGRGVFLDFGIMGRLDARVRRIMRRGVPALIAFGNFKEVAIALYRLGAAPAAANLDEAASAVAEVLGPLRDAPLSQISYGDLLADIVRVGLRFQIRLPRELVLIMKQFIYFERYAKLMAPDWNIMADPDIVGFLLTPDGTLRKPGG
ncbi:MAG: ABC1 kinase family protein [Acidimicrobiia bacterium]